MAGKKRVLLDGYGDHVFYGEIATPYLKEQCLGENILESPSWTTDGSADKPLGSTMLRHGQTAQVQVNMVRFTTKGRPMWSFKGSDLIQGETDGSSYLNGGLRSTHRAGGYLVIDPTSPIFLRDDCIHIPSCFVSYDGLSLDEKTPLLRACDALSREGVRLLGLLGYQVKGLQTSIGLEQELFLIPRAAYLRRPDLQLTGRTIIGKKCARGQELNDHYMAPISHAAPAMACMQEIQQECFKLGIPLRTRHREVAPNQYEFAPLYGCVNVQVDQNLAVMQLVEEVAAKHGLAALLHEKPFTGVNGSGKHNNWSIATDDGTNLLNAKQLEERAGSCEVFPVVMAALVQAVDQYGDLMRMSIASPGNDFRLGACEAPPSIVTTALGDSITKFLQSYMKGEDTRYDPQSQALPLGAAALPPLAQPAEDRNRTSPFPYGGHRFEFRAVGSSQNVSMVNTVLCSMTAQVFRQFSDAIEAGTPAKQVAQQALAQSWKAVFNGNGYDPEAQAELTAKGCWRIDSGVEAICRLREPKNIALFRDLGVLGEAELLARERVMLQQYTGVVELEARCLIDMLQQHVLPSVTAAIQAGSHPAALTALSQELHADVRQLEDALHALSRCAEAPEAAEDRGKGQALRARALRLETMGAVRARADEAEGLVPAHLWTLAPYRELLFMDQTTPA